MYDFAIMEDICEKDYSLYVELDGKEDEEGEPFSEDAIKGRYKQNRNTDFNKINIMLIFIMDVWGR